MILAYHENRNFSESVLSKFAQQMSKVALVFPLKNLFSTSFSTNEKIREIMFVIPKPLSESKDEYKNRNFSKTVQSKVVQQM